MSIARRKLPVIPEGVDVNKLDSNLKLYSDEVIAELKKQFQQNARYRNYLNLDNEITRLPYPVFVFNGRYIAGYPGKELRLGDEEHGVKVAQDLDSGEWVIEKVLKVMPEGYGGEDEDEVFAIDPLDVDQERRMLRERNKAIMAKGDAMYVSRPFSLHEMDDDAAEEETEEDLHHGVSKFADDSSGEFSSALNVGRGNESQSQLLNSMLGGDAENQLEDRVGKHYLFMQRAHGKNLHEWAKNDLPLIVRMEMSIALANVLLAWHNDGFLHRDVKGKNAVYDMIRDSLQMVDVGLSIHSNEKDDGLYPDWGTPGYMAEEITGENYAYSEQSDIYAFGITLGVMWGLIEINEIEHEGEVKYQAELLQKSSLALSVELSDSMRTLVAAVTQNDAEARKSLEDVVHSLHSMLDKFTPNDRTVHVAVVDAGEYLSRMDGGLFNRGYLEDLDSYDMVQLLDVDGGMQNLDLLLVKQDLAAAGMVVDGEICVASLQDMQDHLDDLNKAKPENGRIYRYTIECKRQELALNDSANVLNELEECNSQKADPSVQALQNAYRAPVELRQRRNVSEQRDDVNREDVRLQMSDQPDEPTQRERRQARYEQADPHDWGDWAAWFFGNMAEDSCEIFNAVVDSTLQGLRGFSLFSSCMPCVDPLSPSVTRRLQQGESENPYEGTEMITYSP